MQSGPDNTNALPAYAELHCLSNFTFLRGASHPEELVERAASLGYAALALTDECSLAGVVRAHLAAKEQGLRLLIGSELRITTALGEPWCTLVVLARSRRGYGNLSEFITLARMRAVKGRYRLTPDDFEQPPAGHAHLAGLPECEVLLLGAPDLSPAHQLDCAHWLLRWAGARAALAVELVRQGDDAWHLMQMRALAGRTGLPLVATGGVLMHVRSRKPLQDTLTAIRLNTPLTECGFALEPNAERHLRARVRLAALYPHEALANAVGVAARCTFSLDELKYEYPQELVPPGSTPPLHLRRLVYDGACQRWPTGLTDASRKQIEHELDTIASLRYEPYFLTVHDIVRFARQRGILCQGRGSAANSVVCYCLHITEVDPVLMSMLFERFISKARNEPPDIDVDFEHQRREEVIQYLYEKYGRQRAALTGALITYRTRSALRDIGKALGLDAAVLERVTRGHHSWDRSHDLSTRMIEAGLHPEARITAQLTTLAATLTGFPRHLSQHSGGFVIAQDKLSRLVPIENAAMSERSVIEWDKNDLDALGLLKIDVLALGMLSALRRGLELVARRYGMPRFTLQDMPREDPATYEMTCHADTVGVFQIESRAQQSMLPRMRPRRFYDLVIEVAIVRPGPIQGGMVHPYLRRRQGLEPVEYPKNEVRPALERTLGVPIFQEQVMHLAMLAAGFSAEQADQLRRAMAAWRRKGSLVPYQTQLMDGMLARGYEADFALRICQQIEGFGEYGFPESHAASFALLVYASSWLKRHEPAAFLVALLNSQPLGFYSPGQLIQDARRHGVTVLPPDVMHSDWESTLVFSGYRPVQLGPNARARDGARQPGARGRYCMIEHAARHLDAPPSSWGTKGPAVRLGLSLVKGFSQSAAERIIATRHRTPFIDVDDLARRAALSRRELEALAAADALAALAGHRRQAWWAVAGQQPATRLLRDAPLTEAPLVLPHAPEGREIVDDYNSLGFTLNRHPLALLRTRLTRLRFTTASELATYPNRRLARACGIVTIRQRPGTAGGTMFLSLEDETGAINVIVKPRLIERQRKEALGAALLGVYGVWQREGEVMHLVAQYLADQTALLGSLVARSRDFY